MFAYVFGSGIVVPDGGNYREFLMPGMFAQTMAFGIGETMMAVTADAAKGSPTGSGRCRWHRRRWCWDVASRT